MKTKPIIILLICIAMAGGAKIENPSDHILAQLMGHSSTRTLERYVSGNHKHFQEAVDGLEAQLTKALK